jgi:hypothetical protein
LNPFPLYIGMPVDIDVGPQFPEAQPPPMAAPSPYVIGGPETPGCAPESPQHESQQSPQHSSQALFLPPRRDLSIRQCRLRPRF